MRELPECSLISVTKTSMASNGMEKVAFSLMALRKKSKYGRKE